MVCRSWNHQGVELVQADIGGKSVQALRMRLNADLKESVIALGSLPLDIRCLDFLSYETNDCLAMSI